MHLLNVNTLRLEKDVREIHGKAAVEYGILSHRWLPLKDEVLFQDIESHQVNLEQKPGHYKLTQFCKKARRHGLQYVWIDTCCINKMDSTEVQESINSMYRWYENAHTCYVFLKDTTKPGPGRLELGGEEEWFSRGWTLQELIAPKEVRFYDRNWDLIGTRKSLRYSLSDITGIDVSALNGTRKPQEYSIAQRMSWASGRQTTKGEDRSYSLIGLFDVSMPMLYGEGESKAFMRLQEEIIKRSDDRSIFAWKGLSGPHGLLASSPDAFKDCQHMTSVPIRTGNSAYSMTNRGISITTYLSPWTVDTYAAPINCIDGNGKKPRIYLRRLEADDQYARVSVMGKEFNYSNILDRIEDTKDKVHYGIKILPNDNLSRKSSIYVRQARKYTDIHAHYERFHGFRLSGDLPELLPHKHMIETLGLHRWNQKKRTLHFPGWYVLRSFRDLVELTLTNLTKEVDKIKVIKLGFDFDSNPTLFLFESSAIDKRVDFDHSYHKEEHDRTSWLPYVKPSALEVACGNMSVQERHPDDTLGWNKLWEDGAVVLNNPLRFGLWALKGDRIKGLNVKLENTSIQVILTKRETKDGLIWDLNITNLRKASPRRSGEDSSDLAESVESAESAESDEPDESDELTESDESDESYESDGLWQLTESI
ncbi:HET-domain-containing protein [Hypoxylon sp. NC1633]|nr:HET-domain-containing protein [Hypoxylon sp. NC1633]